MKTITIASAFLGIFSGLFGAFFKMFHMTGGNALLISSAGLTAVAAMGMVLWMKKVKENGAYSPVEVES